MVYLLMVLHIIKCNLFEQMIQDAKNESNNDKTVYK